MNHSKYGLNAPFYKWLDEVRRAMRREQELLQKLEYYNVKFMGYQGITYDRIGSSSKNTSKGDQNMLYWLDKIDEVENQIISIRTIISTYQEIVTKLNSKQKELVKSMLRIKEPGKRLQLLGLSRIEYYREVNNLIRMVIHILIQKKPLNNQWPNEEGS